MSDEVRAATRPGATVVPGPVERFGRLRPLVPGLAAVAAATLVAFGVAAAVPGLGATTVAVVLGALAANLGLHRAVLRPGTAFAAKRLLRVGVVLLGLQLSLGQVAGLGWAGLAVVAATVTLTFTGTQVLGRLLRVGRTRSLLVATGFSICGASAVGAMKEVVDCDEEDVGVAVALVTLCGSLAILLLPPLRGVLGLDVTSFGAWVGASVHDVGQTVATANRVPGALSAAVVVKLSRVVLLAPLVAAVALRERRTAGRQAQPRADGRRPAPVPLFVVGFLVAILVASTGWLPDGVLHAAELTQQVLLVAALVGLGTGIHIAMLRRTGGRALALGLASWVLVAAVAYAGVRLVGA
ncbi:putative sulfate exporter family transporter [Actinotalea sp. M2MS4P-6]|uniref:YeiH family protein n=1 Tax=Actinotalea sp. M2MS4P-6 TaxID=2983762 RepID=UPI0021E35DE5|nr:putative sulfate exporter family transporter [Actinotalea sp. M2MS4P-6]MCV2394028.1 putative sulfate exporter family transporter [Actinotalea sp. M2MS4P-6]